MQRNDEDKVGSLKKEEGPETKRVPCVTSVLVKEWKEGEARLGEGTGQ